MSNDYLDPADWMGTDEFCAIVGKARSTVESERSRGSDGPPYYRAGGKRIRYRRSEVKAWLDARRVIPAAAKLAEEAPA